VVPGQNLAGRGKVGQKTGSVKRGRRGADTREVSRIMPTTTGNSSRFSWNRTMAYGLLKESKLSKKKSAENYFQKAREKEKCS
jgi:hypothetical protein